MMARRLTTVGAVLACLLAGVAGARAQPFSTEQFQATYQGYNQYDSWKWWLTDKCTRTQTVYGSEPAAPGRYPVVVYLHGTLADWGGNAEGRRVAELAAAQGFVAAAFTHSNTRPSQASIDGHAFCIFDARAPGDALAQVCGRPKADCSRGALVTGFSVGGAIAARAKNFAPEVRAAWVMGLNGPVTAASLAPPAGTRALPDNMLRIAIGRSDVEVNNPTTGQVGLDLTALNRLTGQSCAMSPCLRADGSGYHVVQHSQVADGVADHCYWLRVNRFAPTNSCTWNPTFDPGFKPPSTTPWSLITGLAWLRGRLN
jgi:poly(3-hydroxybutyrate) depolymerase